MKNTCFLNNQSRKKSNIKLSTPSLIHKFFMCEVLDPWTRKIYRRLCKYDKVKSTTCAINWSWMEVNQFWQKKIRHKACIVASVYLQITAGGDKLFLAQQFRVITYLRPLESSFCTQKEHTHSRDLQQNTDNRKQNCHFRSRCKHKGFASVHTAFLRRASTFHSCARGGDYIGWCCTKKEPPSLIMPGERKWMMS